MQQYHCLEYGTKFFLKSSDNGLFKKLQKPSSKSSTLSYFTTNSARHFFNQKLQCSIYEISENS